MSSPSGAEKDTKSGADENTKGSENFSSEDTPLMQAAAGQASSTFLMSGLWF